MRSHKELEKGYQAWARELAANTTDEPVDPEGVELLTPQELLARIWG